MALELSSSNHEVRDNIAVNSAWDRQPVTSGSKMGGPVSATSTMVNSAIHSINNVETSTEKQAFKNKRNNKRNSIHVSIPPTSDNEEADGEENLDFSNINDIPHSTSNLRRRPRQVEHNFPSAPYKRLKHPADRSLCFSFCSGLFFCLISLTIGLPIILIIFIFVPICFLVRKLLLLCCCCLKPGVCSCCCADLMSETELLWYQTSSHNALVAQCVITIQHGLDVFRIEDLLNSRLISAENKNGCKQYPRFSQKIVSMPTGYAWIRDPEFSMQNHVFTVQNNIDSVEDLQDFVGDMASKPLNLDHPLWEVHILTDFGKSRDTILLFRIHPCVTDGISLVHILFKGLVDNQSLCNLKPRYASNTMCLNSLRSLLIGPLVFLQKWLCFTRDFNLLHGDHIHLSGKMAVAWSEPFSLSCAQRIKQVSRASLNDVLMSISAGCLRSYLQYNGVHNPYDIKVVVPVDLRRDRLHMPMGNHYSFVDVTVPSNTEGIVPRLWEFKLRMDDTKNSADSTILSSICWLSGYFLSGKCFKQLWRAYFNKFTCFISNLPGPDHRLTFASREIKSLVYWIPPRDEMAVSVNFMTYADELRMSVIADRSVIPHPEIITREFIAQMETLSKLLANRRLPGEHISKRLEALHMAQAKTEDPTLEEIHTRMSDIQQQLQELKHRLDSPSDKKHNDDSAIIQRIEGLKGEFRELMSELRHRRMSEGSSMLSDEEEEEEDEIMRRPFRRRTMSVTSRQSTSSVGSMCRPLTTSPAPHQPFPQTQQVASSSLASVHEEGYDVQRIEIQTYRSQHTVEMVTPCSPVRQNSHTPSSGKSP